MGLVRLDPREVRTFTLREAVLAVKLELSDDNRVLTPTVHIQRGLSEDESTGIRDRGTIDVTTSRKAGKTKLSKSSSLLSSSSGLKRNRISSKVRLIVRIASSVPVSSETSRDVSINGTSILKEATGINECILTSSLKRTSESVDSVRKGINGISVVERLGTKNLEKGGITKEGRTVINVLIRLDNPDKLLHRVVEVELNLVAGRTNGLVTSELKLADKVLVGILGESATLISIKEDVVNIERSGNKRLVVGNNSCNRGSNRVLSSRVRAVGVAVKRCNSPKTLINRTNIKVDFNFVILYITILPHLSMYFYITRGSRLYLKLSLRTANSLKPISV